MVGFGYYLNMRTKYKNMIDNLVTIGADRETILLAAYNDNKSGTERRYAVSVVNKLNLK